MVTSSNPHLQRWHNIVLNRDEQDLHAILAENVIFRSPYVWEPYHGRDAVWRILTTVSQVFQDFTYHREVIEHNNWALEFSACVGDYHLKGIDLIRLDDANLIAEFEVFVRPSNSLRMLGLEMARRMK